MMQHIFYVRKLYVWMLMCELILQSDKAIYFIIVINSRHSQKQY